MGVELGFRGAVSAQVRVQEPRRKTWRCGDMNSVNLHTAKREEQLELDEDRNFQERWWTAERIAWIGFALVIVVALAGLTGLGGPVRQRNGGGADRQCRISTGKPLAGRTITCGSSCSRRAKRRARSAFPRSSRTSSRSWTWSRDRSIDHGCGSDALRVRSVPQQEGHVDVSVRSLHPGPLSYYIAVDGERLPATTFVWP